MLITMWKRSAQVAVTLLLAAGVKGGEVSKRKTETLARHETVAEFRGTKAHRCMGMTSRCPDACGESGSLATFRIINYLAYEKLGEYGDPKGETFAFLVEDNLRHPKVPAAIRAAVDALKSGDVVLLSWNHDYVTVDGSSGPERPLTKLEKLAEIGTKEWLQQVDRRAGLRDAAGRGPAVGSSEWMQAASVKLGVSDDQGHGPDSGSDEWRNAVQWKAFGIKPRRPVAGD